MIPTPTVPQAWAVLAGAIVFEVCGTTCMRLSEGFTRLTPSVLIFVFYALSFALNTIVVKTLGLSVVYAVWCGVGTVLTAATLTSRSMSPRRSGCCTSASRPRP